ncbi:response regulator transcription factor [Enterococcus sp. CWB-B31]|uniref:response regulator transcription factor n=1 Tax=Enterococcus sp. CWB-B31 TaxID=2885159 RepID=UPI001E53556B|nr:response regulator transcription factor [Enterococcus sp. CWB-B31]MCB5955532.1 response regulator transcription factor [Enterococcus sp. CWB-B31]
MRVLMVEDEKYMAKAVAEILKKNHYTVDLVHDGSEGLAYARSSIYDIIILDIMLPGRDGLTILSEIRKIGIGTPVILLTAKGQIEDKVKGLDFGADDYLAKPFHTDELLARLRALHRRKPELCNNGVITFGDIEFSPHTLVLKCVKNETMLKLKEGQLLELLIDNRNIVVSKNTIIERVWGYDTEAEDNHVEIHISRLRKQLTRVKSRISINTIRGAGYTLTGGE